MNERFSLQSNFRPKGDQPQAIEKLVRFFQEQRKFQTLVGVTGSGKTFTLACVIEKINKPTLVISHNKTLAAQLYAEFKEFFPHNAVEYFVSYYDYYQPEAYIPQTDTYIEKDASINERIDRLRLSATSSLSYRRDVLVVASVSCIYNIGSPDEYQEFVISLQKGQHASLDGISQQLVSLQYERADFSFKRGTFRVRGGILDLYPSYKEKIIRIDFSDDRISGIFELHPINFKVEGSFEKINIYPAKHFLISRNKMEPSLLEIKKELDVRCRELEHHGKIMEAERLKKRTFYDLEMLGECGWCHGIENYSRHLSGRPQGSRPYCLLDYFPKDYLLVIDESHMTIPQVRGMYHGDRSRKEVLVEYGFRLPSCLDNRPLKGEEFFGLLNQVIFVSATPAKEELKLSGECLVEQIIRPTGLVDPKIEVRSTTDQIEDLVKEIRLVARKKQRVLVTTLTKRMAEDLTAYLEDEGIRVRYIHSDFGVLDRAKIIQDLRKAEFDCLVGINLLREGLDLPEVALVAVLDADKEGFLRSEVSLIQVIGRAARHVEGRAVFYAETVTHSMKRAIEESQRRRMLQLAYNKKHKITPKTIKKKIQEGIEIWAKAEELSEMVLSEENDERDVLRAISILEKEMLIAAKNLKFERAAELRDKIEHLRKAKKSNPRV